MTSDQTGNCLASLEATQTPAMSVTQSFPESFEIASQRYDAFRSRMLTLHKSGNKPNDEELKIITLMRLSSDILSFCKGQGRHYESYDIERRYAISSLLNDNGELAQSSISESNYKDIANYLFHATWTCVLPDSVALENILQMVSVHPAKRDHNTQDEAQCNTPPQTLGDAQQRLSFFQARILVKEHLNHPLSSIELSVLNIKDLSEEMLLIDSKCEEAFHDYADSCIIFIGNLLSEYGEPLAALNTPHATYKVVELIQMAKRHIRDEAMRLCLDANQIHLRKMALPENTPEARRYYNMYALPLEEDYQ